MNIAISKQTMRIRPANRASSPAVCSAYGSAAKATIASKKVIMREFPRARGPFGYTGARG